MQGADHPPDGPDASSPRAFTAAVVFAVGIVSVALLIGSDTLRYRSTARDTRLLLTMSEIRTSVALAHLWLEEYVSGDTVDIDDIFTHIERASGLVDAMLGRGGEPPLIPATRGELLHRVDALRSSIEDFAAIAAERRQGFERSLPVGIGSTLDVEYDRVFDLLLSQARGLEAAIGARRARQEQRSRLVFLTIVAGWSALITIAAAGLWTRERHRHQVQAELDRHRQQLFQSQKLDALGRLAGGLAHDVNNYLAAIRGHCELVRMKQPSGERLTRKMDSVLATVQKTVTLIDRLLAFSRRPAMDLAVVRPGPVIQGVLRITRPSLGEDVRVRSQIDPDLWNVEADVGQLEQVLVNLLVNARDAMPTGGEITVEARNERGPSGSGDVVLSVRDTGRGIPAGDLEQIFEPFWSTKEKGRAGGLGLPMVHTLIEQHGGTISVSSEVGRGTSFEIRLPRCRRPAPDAPAEIVGEPPLGEGEVVLLVDDNVAFRESSRALLEALGYHVTTAASAEEALTSLTSGPSPDVLLTDVVMPGLSGPELVERLGGAPPPATIFLSGHAEQVASRYGLDPEQVHFLSKQAPVTALAAKIREVLDEARKPDDHLRAAAG